MDAFLYLKTGPGQVTDTIANSPGYNLTVFITGIMSFLLFIHQTSKGPGQVTDTIANSPGHNLTVFITGMSFLI